MKTGVLRSARPMARSPWGMIGVMALTVAVLLIMSHPALAAGAGGGLPYEVWLVKLQASITGPVAFAIAIIGVVIAGGVLIFGGELNGFIRTLIFVVLIMALLVGAQNMMSFFGAAAALMGQNLPSVPAPPRVADVVGHLLSLTA